MHQLTLKHIVGFATILSAMFQISNTGIAATNEWSVPISDDGAMIRVPVTAFGRSLYFLIDTGLSISTIDKKYENQLGDVITENRAESPLSASNNISIYHCPEILLGGHPLKLQTIACMDMTMARLVSGEPCDGMLGMDFFGNKVVSFNFDERLLSLYERTPEIAKSASTIVPIKTFYAHYMVDVLLNGKVPVSLMLDTGDSGSLSFNDSDWEKVFSANSNDVYSATVGAIGSHSAKTQLGRIEKLQLGPLTYTHLHALYIHNRSDVSHLGLNFFRRHVVTFDFPNQKLYLQPGKRFAMPDKNDMSGLHLLRIDGLTVVHSVDENSPAFNAGIRAEDTIQSINGEGSLTMNSIREMLQSEAGKRIKLQMQRGDHSWQTEFTLIEPMP